MGRKTSSSSGQAKRSLHGGNWIFDMANLSKQQRVVAVKGIAERAQASRSACTHYVDKGDHVALTWKSDDVGYTSVLSWLLLAVPAVVKGWTLDIDGSGATAKRRTVATRPAAASARVPSATALSDASGPSAAALGDVTQATPLASLGPPSLAAALGVASLGPPRSAAALGDASVATLAPPSSAVALGQASPMSPASPVSPRSPESDGTAFFPATGDPSAIVAAGSALGDTGDLSTIVAAGSALGTEQAIVASAGSAGPQGTPSANFRESPFPYLLSIWRSQSPTNEVEESFGKAFVPSLTTCAAGAHANFRRAVCQNSGSTVPVEM